MTRRGVMLCYPFEEQRLNKWGFPVYVQPKLDGMRCRAIRMGNLDWTLLSSQCNVIKSVPHINKALIEADIHKDIYELDGEIYTHGMDFNSLVSRTKRTAAMHNDSSSVEYHIFDVVSHEPFNVRLSHLRNALYDRFGPLERVPTVLATDLDEVMNCFHMFVRNKYEGMIVRHPMGIYTPKRSTNIMKFKPHKSDFYIIKGYSVEVDKYKNIKPGRLGRIICAEEASMEVLGEYPPKKDLPTGYFGVGSGLTNEQRISLWTDRFDILENLCEVSYQNITPGKGVPRFPIFVQVVEAPSEEEINLTLGEL